MAKKIVRKPVHKCVHDQDIAEIKTKDYSCTEKEQIVRLIENTNKLSVIITGNGDPEKGLCSKVAIIAERQDGILEKLGSIHSSLADYHTETKEAKEIAAVTQSAFDKYKASVEGEEKGKGKASTQNQVTFNNIITIIGTIILIAGFIIAQVVQSRARHEMEKDLKDKIDNLGTPAIINSRGGYQRLPQGDSIRYFRDGYWQEFNDSIKAK